MKKLYVMMALLSIIALSGCGVKPSETDIATGDVQEITWTTNVPVVSGSEMEEFTGEIDSWVVPTATGSDEVTTEDNKTTDEVKGLINNRKTQPADDTKLTEEDIGLMEQIIQKVQDLGK